MPQASAPFPYPGSKGQLLNWLTDQFPQHDQFIDLFGGSGAVLFGKKQAGQTIFNDANKDIQLFFTLLRDHPEELIERIRSLPYHQSLHERWARQFYGDRSIKATGIDRAAQYYYVRRAQYGGDAASPVGFRGHIDGRRNPARQWANSIERLWDFADQLQGVSILGAGYQTVIQLFVHRHSDTRQLVYCDPPYPRSPHRYRCQKEPQSAASPQYVSHLVRWLNRVQTPPEGPFVAVSTNQPPPDEHSGWVVTTDHAYSMHNSGSQDPTDNETERLLTNYNPANIEPHTAAEGTALADFASSPSG